MNSSLRVSSLLLASVVAAIAADRTPHNLTDFYGSTANTRLVADAPKIEACELRVIESARPGADERYEEGAYIAVPAAIAAHLRATLLDGHSFDFPPAATADG